MRWVDYPGTSSDAPERAEHPSPEGESAATKRNRPPWNEPRVGFGLGSLHRIASRKQRESIVLGALTAGLTHFDLAPAYGDGFCEAETGRILGPRRSAVSLGTKFGIPTASMGATRSYLVYAGAKAVRKALSRSYGSEYGRREFTPEAARRSLEGSLRRLRTDYVDFFFVHEPRDAADLERAWLLDQCLAVMKKEGKILHYGIAASTSTSWATNPGRPLGDAVQFALDSRSIALGELLPEDCLSFAFGLIRYLRGRADGERLDYADMLAWFFGRLPRTTPILASSRPREIARLGRALERLR